MSFINKLLAYENPNQIINPLIVIRQLPNMYHGKVFVLKNGSSNIVVDLVKFFQLEDMRIIYHDSEKPEQYDPEFVKHFPFKRFPAFIAYNHNYNIHFKEDVFKMSELPAVLYCLLSRIIGSNDPRKSIEAEKLLSGEIKDLQAHGANCRWLCFTTTEFIPLIDELYKMRASHDSYNEDAYREVVKKVYFIMEEILEPELENHCFLVSHNHPSICDLYIMTPILEFFSFEYDSNWCKKHTIFMDWFNETSEHPMIRHRLSNSDII